MATRKGQTGWLGLLAFIAIVFVAVAYIFVGIQAAVNAWGWNWNLGRVPSVLQWMASILMTIVIAGASYDYAMRQNKFWRVVWWVLAIIAICAVVGLGGFNAFNA